MIKITKEEVLYIAQLSRIDLDQEEVEPLRQSLEEILTYAARVQELAASSVEESVATGNVLRDDVVVQTAPKPLIAQFPAKEDDYVVVPAVLENE